MPGYDLHTRSFHPGQTFGATGLGFSGDNRGFSTSLGATSRIKHFATIDLRAARLIDRGARSDSSHHEGMGTTQTYEDPKKQPVSTVTGSVLPYRPDGDQRFEAVVSYHGKNYAFPGADWERQVPGTPISISPRHGIRRSVPDLDVTNTVFGHIDRVNRKLHVTCDMRGDGFPNCESFLVDDANQVLFLASHVRVGVATMQLWGNRRIPMGRCQLEVDLNADDSFASNVRCFQALDYAGDGSPVSLSPSGSSTMSRAAWNRLHTGRDALGPESRRNLDNSFIDAVKDRLGLGQPARPKP